MPWNENFLFFLENIAFTLIAVKRADVNEGN